MSPDCSHRVLNPRAELDRQLKQACEDVIMAAMRSNIGPLLHFLTSVTAAQASTLLLPFLTKCHSGAGEHALASRLSGANV